MTERRLAFATTGTPRPPTPGLRTHLFEDMFARRYDESLLDPVPTVTGVRRVPSWFKLAREIRRRADEYDAVVSWSEGATVALMTLDGVRRSRRPHIAMMYWFSRPFVRLPMRAFGDRLQAIVTWSSVQREYAIRELGMPSERIYFIRHYVEQAFWSPRDVETDMICSAGAEMRDYPTLIEALRGTDLRCHIATDHVRTSRRMGFGARTHADRVTSGASDNVTIGRKPPHDLRALYARSRFVVVPLHPSDTDNGVTVILEAMAMGKPVICSRTQGQVDVIKDGVTGIFVPVGDPVALRRAMLDLWNDPERAKQMGQAGRAYIEKHHTLDDFCAKARTAIEASLDGRPARADGSFD